MEINKVLSYLGGYFNATEFELDIPKIADVSELSEDEVTEKLNELQAQNVIQINDNTVSLIDIKPSSNASFNDMYKPVETMNWDRGMKLKLDK